MSGALGELSIKFRKRQDGRTCLAEQYFKLPLQILPPHYQDEDGTAFVYLLNPSGGILQHDVLLTDILVEKDASAYVTTPSANKFYKMDEGFATIKNKLTVESGGVLEYMPEHNVPFAKSRTYQETEIYLDKDATLIANDMFTSGRLARGESFDYTLYASKIKILVDGKLSVYDNMVIEPEKMQLGGMGVFENYSIVSTLYIYSPGVRGIPVDELNEKINPMQNIRAGITKVEDAFIIIRLLGNSVIDMQDAIKEIWNCFRMKLLDKEAVRIRKY